VQPLLIGSPMAMRSKVQKKNKETPSQGEGTEHNLILSFPLSIIMCCLFVWAGFESQQWPEEVSQFPYIAVFPGVAFILFILVFDGLALLAQIREQGSISKVMAATSEKAVLSGALVFFGYLLAMILIMLIIGQKFALPLFILTYLLCRGNYNWKIALGYATGGDGFCWLDSMIRPCICCGIQLGYQPGSQKYCLLGCQNGCLFDAKAKLTDIMEQYKSIQIWWLL